MDALQSTRFFNRARPSSQRGYALVSAIVLAVLYFALIELLLIDSARELSEARRFRARIVAETLAENAAELAALQIVTREATPPFTSEITDGTMSGRMFKNPAGGFDIEAEGRSSGLTESKARVIVRGRVVGTEVRIQYTIHTY